FGAHFRSRVDDDPARRIAEARAAAAYVEATARERPDAIVVLGGDLNDVPGSDTLDAIEQSGSLVRVARELDDAHAATYDYFGQLLALDHLYVEITAAGAPVPGTVRVRRDSSRGLGGSDHAALVADFHHVAR
ncbi:MAG: endonuclease/exonuclease/phosphatase family protein, partial [Deltaproteobacteria bacterium]|nr:endonuclease/exonuclease/phosphatase family protein [Deltaproteobacteria bacterium]